MLNFPWNDVQFIDLVLISLAFCEIVIESDGRNVVVAKKVIERKILGEFDVFLAHG